jgi:hypothetical protein
MVVIKEIKRIAKDDDLLPANSSTTAAHQHFLLKKRIFVSQINVIWLLKIPILINWYLCYKRGKK